MNEARPQPIKCSLNAFADLWFIALQEQNCSLATFYSVIWGVRRIRVGKQEAVVLSQAWRGGELQLLPQPWHGASSLCAGRAELLFCRCHSSVCVHTRLKGKARGTIRSGEYKGKKWAVGLFPAALSPQCLVFYTRRTKEKSLCPSRAAEEKEQRSTNRWWNCHRGQLCCTSGARLYSVPGTWYPKWRVRPWAPWLWMQRQAGWQWFPVLIFKGIFGRKEMGETWVRKLKA